MITREILTEELSKLEQRFDSKVDITAVSFKEYTDSKVAPINTKLDSLETSVQELRQDVKHSSAKTERYFNGIVKMIEGLTGSTAGMKETLADHGRRITVLETKH